LGFDVSLNNNIGLALRTGTDPAIRQILEDFLMALPNDPEYREAMRAGGMPIDPLTGAEYLELIRSEIAKIRSVLGR
jgi:tripartite-type tricarboxylate transporter receptor subunit TctC